MGSWYMLLFSCHSLFNSKYESIWAIFQTIKQCCCSSVTKSWRTLWDLMDGNNSGSSVLHCLLEFVQIHVHWVGDTIQSSNLLPPPSLLPSIFPSIRIFSNESVFHIRWPKYWSFNFSISLSNGYSGWVSFRTDWFDLLDVQGTLKSLIQHHSSKTSSLQCLGFFRVQLSHMFMTTGKT